MLKSCFKPALNALLFAALAQNLTACSTDIIGSDRVHSEDIYQAYEAHYSADTQMTEVDATFRLGGSTGTTIEFKDPSKLVVNGHETKHNTFLGSHYSAKLGNGFVPNITTEWTTQDGQVYTNSFQIKSVYSRNPIPRTLYLQVPTTLNLIVPEFMEGETVEVIITQASVANNGTVSAYARQFNSYNGQITIQPSDLAHLTPGPATLQIRRSYHVTLQQKTPVGGNAFVTYADAKVNVQLE